MCFILLFFWGGALFKKIFLVLPICFDFHSFLCFLFCLLFIYVMCVLRASEYRHMCATACRGQMTMFREFVEGPVVSPVVLLTAHRLV